jgi:hypothetical protein
MPVPTPLLSPMLFLLICIVFTATLLVTVSAGGSSDTFGLEIMIGKHASGCLVVKSTTGNASKCGIRRFDLICSADDMDLTADSMHVLKQSTPCAVFTVRHHTNPCLSMPLKNAKIDPVSQKVDIGLKLKMSKIKHPDDPDVISSLFTVESVAVGSLASEYAIFPGDWIRSIDGSLLVRKNLGEVKRLLEGGGGGTLELCAWSGESRLSNLPEHGSSTGVSLYVLAFSVGCGLFVIVLLFRTTRPLPPMQPLPPVLDAQEAVKKREEAVRELKPLLTNWGVNLDDLMNEDNEEKRCVAEEEVAKKVADATIPDSEKSNVRAQLIRLQIHEKVAERIARSFNFNADGVPDKRCLRELCSNPLSLKRLRHDVDHYGTFTHEHTNSAVTATTRQDRESYESAALAAFDILMNIAKLDEEGYGLFQRGTPDFVTLLDIRLAAINALAHCAHISHARQRRAEKEGIFTILFAISKDAERSKYDHVLECFWFLIKCNYRLQLWFKQEWERQMKEGLKPLPCHRPSRFQFSPLPSPNFAHIEDLPRFREELLKRKNEPHVVSDVCNTVPQKGNTQIDGTCYAFASARSFIHWYRTSFSITQTLH